MNDKCLAFNPASTGDAGADTLGRWSNPNHAHVITRASVEQAAE
jgi:hypothetical protein